MQFTIRTILGFMIFSFYLAPFRRFLVQICGCDSIWAAAKSTDARNGASWYIAEGEEE